jgi:short-subunit dehydrogenase
MNALHDFVGAWALVTGASSGIGREFACRLAAEGLNLVLVARREPQLATLADELARRHGCRTLVVPADLGDPLAAQAIRRQIKAKGVTIRLLVNNAAAGRWGPFEDTPAETYEAMIRLNVAAPVSLCYRFLADLASYPSSAVINVSSPAAFQPVPYMAVYAASKAFVQSFSQALHGEWQGRGILVQTLVPGPTESEFDEKAGAYDSALTADRADPAVAVQAALAHLDRDRPVVVSAKGTVKQRLFAALAPPRMVIREVGKMFRPAELRSSRRRGGGRRPVAGEPWEPKKLGPRVSPRAGQQS